jgi:hypothetical protein
VLVVCCAAAVLAAEESMSLTGSEAGPRDTELKPDEEEKTDKIPDVKSLRKYIFAEEAKVQKDEMSKLDADGGSGEEVAIGDTLKELDAEHAVEEEMTMEVSVDCEVSEWGKFSKCDKPCDGGKMQRERSVMRKNRNGGKRCPDLSNQVECNTDSCASEEYQRAATRRKLTQREKAREMMANKQKISDAMKSTDTYTMMKRTREVMRKIVHTQVAEVHLPGDPEEQSPEVQVRETLQEAMAKNAVNSAMENFDEEEAAAGHDDSAKAEEDFKKSTAKPLGKPAEEPVRKY